VAARRSRCSRGDRRRGGAGPLRADRRGAARARGRAVHGRRRSPGARALRGADRRRHPRRAADGGHGAARPRGGDARGRRPPLLFASGSRSGVAAPGDQSQCLRGPHRRGRLDDCTADGQAAHPAPGRGAAARRPRQGARDGAGAAPRAPARQARGARAVPEPGVVRQPDGGRRAREPAVLRRRALDAHAGAGGVPRGAAAAADRVQPVERAGVGADAPAGGAPAHARRGLAQRRAMARGARRADRAAAAARAVRSAALRADGPWRAERIHLRSLRELRWTSRHHARPRLAARGRGHRRTPAPVARLARRRQRRRRRARQPARRVAGVGGIGGLRRRGARRDDQRTVRAQAAGIRAQAVYLRAGVRAGALAGIGPPRHSIALRDGAGRRALQPAQLRRPVPRPAARAKGARRLRQHPRGRARVRCRRQHAAALLQPRRHHDLRSQPGLLRRRPDAGGRGSPPRRTGRGVCVVRARRPVAAPDGASSAFGRTSA